MDRTVDDLSSASEDLEAAPAIVMVASGSQPASLVLPVPAELGRRIFAGGKLYDDVEDGRLSRDHAFVKVERGMWVISDRGSRNGTSVNGEKISGELRVRGDAVVRLGNTVFVLLADGRGHGEIRRGEHIVGPELARAYELIDRYAELPALLLHGEPGSGKELAARRYHERGPRRAGPFVAIDCSLLTTASAEAALFGSRKGAFTEVGTRDGYFVAASGGTLFLDEIAELSLDVQPKLLRALQERTIIPAGSTTAIPVNVGVVAASHKELRKAVEAGKFRSDVYYRIGQTTVSLPPLRARKVDIVRLVQREVAAVAPEFHPHAKLLEECCRRPWPGNVRELVAAIHQATRDAVAKHRGDEHRHTVLRSDLPPTAGLPLGEPGAESRPVARGTSPGATVARKADPSALDRETIVATLARVNGNVSAAAEALDVHRNSLYRVMEKFEIKRGAGDLRPDADADDDED